MNGTPADRLRPAAIALVVVGALDVLVGMLLGLGLLASIANGSFGSPGASDARAAGAVVGGIGAPVLCLAVGALVILGGVALLRLRSRTLGMGAAITAMLPISCCFPVGIGVGIWVLVVLGKPDVRALFPS